MATSDETILDNQKTILENQETLLKNQSSILSNQEAILKNQDEIKGNQETIVGNQSTIVDNQQQIADNQKLLNAISKTQAYILNAVRKNGGVTESVEDTESFLKGLVSGAKEAKTDLAEPESL